MKKSIVAFAIVSASLSISAAYCQKLKTEVIKYNYNRLPALPVKDINNYQVTLQATYEAKNAQLMKDYEQQKQAAEDKYRRELASYATLVKAANDRYDKELAEYNKKTLGTKIAESSLLGGKKPVREIISKPYLDYVQKPDLQAVYDYGTLGDTYIHLEGYQNNPANAMKIVVLLYGYDHTQPRTMDEQSESLSIGQGPTSTRKVTSYHTEFSYRYPMAVKVYSPTGKEMLSLTPPELNSYKIYKGSATDRPSIINTELLVKTSQEKVLQDNLRFINNLLNDKFGFSSIPRDATLYYIKNADESYSDLTTAFNEASSGFLMLQKDNKSANEKLEKACDLWQKALKESDLSNKKARINKDITLGIYFDLMEAYFALGNIQEGQSVLDKMNTMSLANSDRKTKLDFDLLFAELKNRQSNN